jgi:hypothetical protein
MQNSHLRHLTALLSADVRDGRFEADWDLGKSEYLGEAQEKEAAYLALARPVLQVYLARGLVTDEEFSELMRLGDNRDRLADQLQALAETLPPD